MGHKLISASPTKEFQAQSRIPRQVTLPKRPRCLLNVPLSVLLCSCSMSVVRSDLKQTSSFNAPSSISHCYTHRLEVSVVRKETMEKLPHEILHEILSHLDCRTLVAMSSTSRAWLAFCHDPLLWQHLYAEEGWLLKPHMDAQMQSPMASKFSRSCPKTTVLSQRLHSDLDWYSMYRQERRFLDNWRRGRCTHHQLPHPDRKHEGHTDDVYAIQLCGRRLVSGGLDKTIRIWDLDRQCLVGKPRRGHHDGVLSLHCDSDIGGDCIVSGGGDGQVISWRFSASVIIRNLPRAHRKAVTGIKLDDCFVITASHDATIKVWDRQMLCGQDHLVRDAPSTTGQRSASVSPLKTLRAHQGGVNAIDLAGDVLVSASADRTVKIWSISGGCCLGTVDEPRAVACLTFDGQMILSGGRDNSVRIYNARLEPQGERLFGHTGLVRTVSVRPGRLSADVVASGSYDGSILIWTKTREGKWRQCRRISGLVPPGGKADFGMAMDSSRGSDCPVHMRCHTIGVAHLATSDCDMASTVDRDHSSGDDPPFTGDHQTRMKREGTTATRRRAQGLAGQDDDARHRSVRQSVASVPALRIIGIQLDRRGLAYCSERSGITYLDFTDGDAELCEEVSARAARMMEI